MFFMKYFFPFFLACSLLSCATESPLSFNPMEKPQGVTTIKIKDWGYDAQNLANTQDGYYKYSDLFSHVDYIKLEATEESRIAQIYKLQITQEKDFIVWDYHNGVILRFDQHGKFLNKIGSRGHGSDEYVRPIDVAYDRFNNQVVVNDNAQKSILFYSIEGQLIKKLKLDFYFSTLNFVDNDRLVLFVNHWQANREGETDYNYKIINHDGDILDMYNPYQHDRHGFNPLADRTFKVQNGLLLCNEYYSPLIFTFTDNGMVPLFYLDFGNKQFEKDLFFELKLGLFNKKVANNADYAYCHNFFMTKNKYIIVILENHKGILYVQDKKDPSKTVIASRAVNDVHGCIPSSCPNYVDDEKFYNIIDPYRFSRLLENGTDISDEDKAFLSEMAAHSNPILQVCTLK